MIGRRGGIALALSGLVGQAGAQAPWKPSRPVRVIVPFAASGGADVFIRMMSESLAEALGQPIIIENRPGGGATIGTDFVAKSPPDGHTLLIISSAQATNETLMPNRPYVLMRDFMPVAMLVRSNYILVTTPGLPVRSTAELIAYAKANPGKLDYASSGPGTPYHFAGAVFAQRAGIDVQHVPFRQASDGRNAVVAGPGAFHVRRHRHHAAADARRARARPGDDGAGALAHPARDPAACRTRCRALPWAAMSACWLRRRRRGRWWSG